MIRFSYFNHAFDKVPKTYEMPWDQFVAGLGPHRFDYVEKEQCPAFSPAEFRDSRKLETHVIRVSFGVLDLDMISAEQLCGIVEKLTGLDAVLYTTFRHSEVFRQTSNRPGLQPLWKVRVCVRLSRPIEVIEWDSFWFALTVYFNGLNDPQCKDPSRIYFGAFAPPGTPAEDCFFEVFHGAPLDVSTLTAQAFVSPPPVGTEKISRDRLHRIAVRWKRQRDPYRSEMGETLLRVCKGESYAEPGNRDNVLYQLCADIARELPHGDPESIAAHFAQSLQVCGTDPIKDLDKVREKLTRAQSTAAAEEMARQLAEIQETKLRIRQAFAPTDPTRDYPYTGPELDAMASRCLCTRDELRTRWIIQRGSLFYVLGPEGYSPPYTEKDVGNAVLRDLSPAMSAGVTLFVETDKGPVRKSPNTLMGEYGTVATDYVLDLRAQEARYVAAEKLFIEAPTPLRNLSPQWDFDVAAWLEILAGPKHHADLLNWLAQCTDLDKTCAALLLTGRKDTGKSLLAYGVSRLWTVNGPTKLSSALGEFNDAIAHCPLVFADEQLPKDFRGKGRTAELREFIADRARPFKKKFYPESSILGAIRLIVAANNDEIMAIQEHLSVHDIEAIADRFYHIRVMPEAADFLRLVDTNRFIQGDAIARHALWLRDNYPIVREGRFLIKSKDHEFYRGLATRSGIRSNVLQWLIGYLRAPARIDARGDFGVRIKDGFLFVRSETVLESWATYVGNVPAPQAGHLAQAIVELSTARIHLSKPGGKSAHYRKIDPAHLFAWAQQTEFMTRAEIETALAQDTEARILSTRILDPSRAMN